MIEINFYYFIVGLFMGIDFLFVYFDYFIFNFDIKKGVNFVFGVGGILDEFGYNYVCLFCFLIGMIFYYVYKSIIKIK